MRYFFVLLSLVLGLALPAAAQEQQNPLEAYVYPGATMIDSVTSYRATLNGKVVPTYTLSFMVDEPIEKVAAFYELEIAGAETTETNLGVQSKSVLVAPPGSIRGLRPETTEVQAELSQMSQGPTRVLLRSGVEESAAAR